MLKPSEDVVARVIAGELIIVPLVAGMGDMEDELFTLNETGKAIWDRLDGRCTLREIARHLMDSHVGETDRIPDDVIGFAAELAGRGMLVTASES